MTKTTALKSVPKTSEPDDAYDRLSQIDKDCYDFISQNGWTPQFDGQHWTAKNNVDGSELGPVLTLPTLKTRVLKALKAAEKEVFGEELTAGDETDESDFKGRNTDQHPTREAAKVEPGTILEEGHIILKEDAKGNTYLPGAEEIVDIQLKDAAFTEFADKEAWKEAGKKKKESKAALDAVAATKRHLFYPDPENSNDLICKVGGITVRMEKDVSVKVKTEKTKDEDED
jgi:hypothetical protein